MVVWVLVLVVPVFVVDVWVVVVMVVWVLEVAVWVFDVFVVDVWVVVVTVAVTVVAGTVVDVGVDVVAIVVVIIDGHVPEQHAAPGDALMISRSVSHSFGMQLFLLKLLFSTEASPFTPGWVTVDARKGVWPLDHVQHGSGAGRRQSGQCQTQVRTFRARSATLPERTAKFNAVAVPIPISIVQTDFSRPLTCRTKPTFEPPAVRMPPLVTRGNSIAPGNNPLVARVCVNCHPAERRQTGKGWICATSCKNFAQDVS